MNSFPPQFIDHTQQVIQVIGRKQEGYTHREKIRRATEKQREQMIEETKK